MVKRYFVILVFAKKINLLAWDERARDISLSLFHLIDIIDELHNNLTRG